MLSRPAQSKLPLYIKILGINYFIGSLEKLFYETLRGGLIVVPSAPVLANLPHNSAHRTALEGSDLAITDSGLLVLLWLLFQHKKLIRISGLRYLRHLLEQQAFRRAEATYWVMPTSDDAVANRQWLALRGIIVTSDYCYVAPIYTKQGEITDPALLTDLDQKQPRFVILNLGGGVQERLGYYLRTHLSYRPAIICTGAAIAFLSARQTTIPIWADRLMLGWFFRVASNPKLYLPRYWQSLSLVKLLWKHGSNRVAHD